uniref:Sorting nexin-1 n=2 Tax=Nothobranchius korthausae TaxID=1143690 RepID=A0A1A8EUD7_9TELE
MASSSERSPPPFPESEDPEVLEAAVPDRDSDEDEADDPFLSASNTPLTRKDTPAAPASPDDPLVTSSQSEHRSASRSSEDFMDVLNISAKAALEDPADDFVDILRGGASAQGGEDDAPVKGGAADPPAAFTAPVMELRDGWSASSTQQPLVSEKIPDPLVELLGEASAVSDEATKPSGEVVDLFDDEGSNIVTGAVPAEPADIFTKEDDTMSNTKKHSVKNNGVHSAENTDIFAEATVELSLDSPRNERKKKPTASPSLPAAASLTKPECSALEEVEEGEEEDRCDITVSVTDPEKIGDGMTAYVAYKVSTETLLPMFRNKTFTVRRRFSDFLGLYEKLSDKHGPSGLIVPPPPEKSILGMTKVKVGKEDSSSADFQERRRGALERYLQRVVNHPLLLQDPDVREFLEKDELPRAVSTQALSGAGFLKMLNRATDAVSKMTIKMNESDVWFEEKLQEVESADQHFRKLHTLAESLVVHRKELSLNTAGFAKSAAMLGSAEDNTALSRALSQLAEVEDKIEQLHQDQAVNDTFSFSELIADYIRLLGAVRGTFDQRMKAWQRWQDAQAMLQKKRETEAKLLWANKPDKLQLAKEEITEWEAKVTQYERDFERVSATVREEVLRFQKEKTKNFKRQIIVYLESLLQSQQQMIKYWEAFLPEAKAIA